MTNPLRMSRARRSHRLARVRRHEREWKQTAQRENRFIFALAVLITGVLLIWI